MKLIKFSIPVFLILSVLLIACNKSGIKNDNSSAGDNTSMEKDTSIKNEFKIEFVELGSVNCIPCKKMQPVMESIESKYNGLVKVTFHDVWKDDASAKRLDELQDELKELISQRSELRTHWEMEKGKIQKIRTMKSEIENLKL